MKENIPAIAKMGIKPNLSAMIPVAEFGCVKTVDHFCFIDIIEHNMLKIRLTRIGRKHDPSFRVVVTDSRRAPRSGVYLENLGFYNPRIKTSLALKDDRIKFWISKGAQVSDVVHNLFVSEGITKGKKINVSSVKKKEERPEEKKP